MATGLDAQQKIFASDPDDRRAFEALEEYFFLEGDWESLTGLYRGRLAAASVMNDDDARAPLLFRLGQILEERILDLEAAMEVYWTLARLDPGNRPALRQLRGMHERQAQWGMVLQIAELESATAMPPYERAAFESELGRTWHKHLGDPEEACRAYERALESDPEFPAALEGLAELYQASGRLTEAASTLERLTIRLRGPERAPAWISLGRLYAGPFGDPARARKCFAAALDDDPFQAPAVEWSLLLATADEDWPVVSDLLESRFDLASGARHRAAIAVEASQIQLNHLGSRASARAWIDRATELGSEEPAVLLAASDVERADGDRDALLHNLDHLITLTGKNAPRSALVEAAELHADFGNPDAALNAVRRAAARSGHDDERVLTLQARLLREGGSKRELAEVLETHTAMEDAGSAKDRAARLRELASLQENDLGDDGSAATNWRRAFDLEPEHPGALEALERIYRKQDDWDALRSTLEAAIEATRDAPEAAMLARLGALAFERFDDAERARTLFNDALASDPACASALTGLRQVANATGDPGLLLDVCEREAEHCHDAEQMGALVNTVIPILEGRNDLEAALGWATRWSAKAPATEQALVLRAEFESRLERPEAEIDSRRSLARLQAGLEQSKTLARQAELHLQLGQDLEAGSALEQALTGQPESHAILRSLGDVYRRIDRPHDLARVLRLLADDLPTSEQAETLEELASILHDPLGDLDAAIVVRWRLAELPDCPADASEKLEALLDSAGRYAELVHLLDTQRQRLGDDAPDAFGLDLRRATLFLDSLGQFDEAAEIFSSLHERHPESDEIIVLLERALRGGDDAAALCSLLERRAEWESDDERRTLIQLERALLMEEALGEPHAACDLYEMIVTEHAGSEAAETAGRRLEILLESTAQWERLRDRLKIRAEAMPPEDQATIREELAILCRERLHDIAQCAEQLEIIAEVTTDRVHVWQQLEAIYSQALDRPADWLRVVEAELDCGPSSDREFMLRVGAARLFLDDDRRPEGRCVETAYEHYERVLEIRPSHAEAAEVLAMHYSSSGRGAETARILESRLAHLEADGGSEVTDLQLRLGALFAGALADDERARRYLEAAFETLGAVDQVTAPLAELYERTQSHDALSDLCHAVLDAADRDGVQLPWRVRLGASELALDHFDEAAVAYRAALVESPDDREIEDALIEIYQRVDELEPLTELLEKRLTYAREDEAIDLRLRLARLHADGRDEPREALLHLEWILDHHPQHRDAFDHAVELAERLQDSEQLLTLLDRSLSTPLPDAERADILERRAHLLASRLGSPEQAVLSFREAIALDPERESARHALREQLEQLERWPAVLDCLFVEARNSTPERRIALFEEASEIAWSNVSPDASLPWLARLQDERPEDPELFARIAEVHRRAGRFEAALRALDSELTLRTSDEECADLHLQRARLLERELHVPARAIKAYQQALSIATDSTEILAELDRLFGSMGRTAERVEILEARIDHLVGEECENARRTLTSLLCVDLAKPERALPYLKANVESSHGRPQDELAALGALDAALLASGRTHDWVEVAERQLQLIDSDADLRANTPEEFKRYLREEVARTYDELVGDAERALDHLRILCTDEDPDNPIGRERFRDLLRRTGRRPELARELSAHLATGFGGASDWLELGRIREEDLLDLAGASEAYREAESEEKFRLEALRGLRRCSERLRDWDALTYALEAEYQLAGRLQRFERTALARRLGDVHWQRRSDGKSAAHGYRLALDLDSNDLAALRSLIAIKEARAEIPDAIDLYRQELEVLGTESESRPRQIEIWLRLATLYGDSDDAHENAIDAYRAADLLERLSPANENRLARLLEAAGDLESFCETFARWCDREDSPATVWDHLELAQSLIAREEFVAARARCERATAVAPESAPAWSLLAELERDDGEAERAADAFERAADHAPPREAANHHTAAAACAEDLDIERAHRLLKRAIALDPAALSAHAALTRVSSRLDHTEETEREAEATLQLAHAEALGDDLQLEVAILGGRAAKKLVHRDALRRLFESALEIDPDHVEALENVGTALFEEGDFSAARVPLERRIDLGGPNPDSGLHLSMIARGLEADDQLDGAWARYEEAIEADRGLEDAHEGLVRVHERAARPEEALAALERWSDSSTDPETRAQAAFRAAEHAIAGERIDRALDHLTRATEANPQLAPAWLLLCHLMGERGPDHEVRQLCEQALEVIEPGPLSAQISMRAARLAEIAGDMDVARERYGEAARWDPRATEAALCESRLARLSGDWVEADGVLARFLENHPDSESRTLAHVHLERGRLLSGPLEQFNEAVGAYERALNLQPEMGVARTSLASLLMHSPERWRDALALHRGILEASPTTATSLRALGQLAERREQTDIATGAFSVLRALGLASPQEDPNAPARLAFPIHPGPPMAGVESERLRRIAHQVSEELGSVLADATPDRPGCEDSDVEAVLEQISSIEDEISAPGLARLESEERAALFSSLGALFLDPGGNGQESRFRSQLEEALGRWTRRKVRKIVEETSLSVIESIDHQAWGDELRAIAAAQVIDRFGGDLRNVLRALLILDNRNTGQPAYESAEIDTLASTSAPVRMLLTRITSLLCERLERSR